MEYKTNPVKAIREKCLDEVWADVVGYEGKYQVSNMGRVKSMKRTATDKNRSYHTVLEKVLKPTPDKKSGHMRVGLWKDACRTVVYVHRLVMEAFVGECPYGLEVCHGDGNPSNNRLDNLRYDTRSENMIDASKLGKTPTQKLLPSDVIEIRKWLSAGENQYIIAEDYGVCQHQISAIKTGRTFAWLK